MKKTKLMFGGLLLALTGALQAQVAFTAPVGNPPAWGPTNGAGVRFYYIPDIKTYYDVSDGNYIYRTGGKWTDSPTLPHRYRNYDLYEGHKVALVRYHGESPYENYNYDRKNYPKGYFRLEPQKTFGEKSNGYATDNHKHIIFSWIPYSRRYELF